jgi:hypothetical protein
MRAQAWSFDFMASVIVFFLVVSVLFFVWQYTTIQNEDQMVFNDMENSALTITDTIIRSRGYPEDWNESSVQIIGLASEENILNETKILTFVQMDYETVKRILGIGAYDFYFQLVHLNGTQASSGGNDLLAGLDPAFQSSTMVVPIERYIVFDHRVAKLRFMLWR